MQASETTNHHFASIEDAKTFALAGNAILTLESLKTGAHFTFKVREAKDGDVYFVNLLANGSADEGFFTYVGLIREGRFLLTKNSKVSIDAASFKAFNYFWNRDHNGEIPAQLRVMHAGRCGRCGRTLTEPESLDSGFGPECREIMGLDL